MKRLLLICLALILVLSLCSCKLFDKKLFGDPDDKTVSEDPADKSDDKTEDKAPEGKSDDPATNPQDPSGEDPIEVIPSDEQPVEDETDTNQGTSLDNLPKPKPPVGNTDPEHDHVYDQEVVAYAYSAEEYASPNQEYERYYKSCECGAASPTETFVHHHNFNQEVPSPEYKVVIEDANPEEQEAIKYQYYFSCKCGKRSTANGTFESKVEITSDIKYYGTLVAGTPVN